MSPIVTDVERPPSHSTPRSASERSAAPAGARTRYDRRHSVLEHCGSCVARPVGADSISDAKAKAAQIESELATHRTQMSALSQQYDAARSSWVRSTPASPPPRRPSPPIRIRSTRTRPILEKAAIANYVSDGAAQATTRSSPTTRRPSARPPSTTRSPRATSTRPWPTCTPPRTQLTRAAGAADRPAGAGPAAVAAEQAAVTQNAQVVQEQSNALAQENGQIATLVQQQAAAEAAAGRSSQRGEAGRRSGRVLSPVAVAAVAVADPPSTRPPPTPHRVAAGGSGAVAAAESQIGVPYVWGGETPGVGFDCSGLTAWSWGQVGRRAPPLLGGPDGGLHPGPAQ